MILFLVILFQSVIVDNFALLVMHICLDLFIYNMQGVRTDVQIGNGRFPRLMMRKHRGLDCK